MGEDKTGKGKGEREKSKTGKIRKSGQIRSVSQNTSSSYKDIQEAHHISIPLTGNTLQGKFVTNANICDLL